MIIDLIITNANFRDAPYEAPEELWGETVYRVCAYQDELEMTDENPYGTKSTENTCGYCGKTGFKKVVEPRTLYTHNQLCDACGGRVMIDSYYYVKYFGKGVSLVG